MMIKFFFNDGITSVSTILLLCLIVFIVYNIYQQDKITHWGRNICILVFFGLCLCFLVAVRDNYIGSVKNSMDDVSEVGLFTIESIQSSLTSIGGAIILISSILSLFLKKNKQRKNIFFVISTIFVLKLLLIEISRILLL